MSHKTDIHKNKGIEIILTILTENDALKLEINPK